MLTLPSHCEAKKHTAIFVIDGTKEYLTVVDTFEDHNSFWFELITLQVHKVVPYVQRHTRTCNG